MELVWYHCTCQFDITAYRSEPLIVRRKLSIFHNIELWNFTGGDLEEHFGYKGGRCFLMPSSYYENKRKSWTDFTVKTRNVRRKPVTIATIKTSFILERQDASRSETEGTGNLIYTGVSNEHPQHDQAPNR